MMKWKYKGVKCKDCNEQAVVKGYCRKCYEHTPERIELHRVQSRESYRRKRE